MIDLGLMKELYSDVNYKVPSSGFNIKLDIPLPSIGMRLYFGLRSDSKINENV